MSCCFIPAVSSKYTPNIQDDALTKPLIPDGADQKKNDNKGFPGMTLRQVHPAGPAPELGTRRLMKTGGNALQAIPPNQELQNQVAVAVPPCLNPGDESSQYGCLFFEL